jgi:opacity protein-like surface antigen
MTRILSSVLALGLLAGVSTTALAADADVPPADYAAMGFYLRGDAGWSYLDTRNGDGGTFVLGGGIGYKVNDYLRADLRGDMAGLGGDEYLDTITGNLYFDIPTDTMLTPYVGAGVGYGWASGNDDGMAYALMAGDEVNISESVSADVGYRYRQILDGTDPSAHEVMAGLRFKF